MLRLGLLRHDRRGRLLHRGRRHDGDGLIHHRLGHGLPAPQVALPGHLPLAAVAIALAEHAQGTPGHDDAVILLDEAHAADLAGVDRVVECGSGLATAPVAVEGGRAEHVAAAVEEFGPQGAAGAVAATALEVDLDAGDGAAARHLDAVQVNLLRCAGRRPEGQQAQQHPN